MDDQDTLIFHSVLSHSLPSKFSPAEILIQGIWWNALVGEFHPEIILRAMYDEEYLPDLTYALRARRIRGWRISSQNYFDDMIHNQIRDRN